MYCCQLWFNSTKSNIKKLSTGYNSVLRRLLCISKPYSASNMLVYVACQRYLCPNVIPMTMNVFIFRNISLKTVFIEPYVKINYSLSLSLSLSLSVSRGIPTFVELLRQSVYRFTQ